MHIEFPGFGGAPVSLSWLKAYYDALEPVWRAGHPLVREAMLHMLFGEFQQAEGVLTRALEEDGGLTHAYFLRALAYGAQEMYEPAVSDCTAVLAQDPTHALAYELRGATYMALGRDRLAISDFDAALGLPGCENGAELYEKRGAAYSRLGEHRLAVESFDGSLATGPSNQKVLRRRAGAHLWLADVKRANADYALAWRLEPRSCEAWWYTEWTSLCLGPDTPEERAARVERLRRLSTVCLREGAAPFEPRLGRLCAGVADFLAGEEAAARQVFEAMFPEGEGAGDTCYWLGMTLLSGGDDDGAVACIAAALDCGVQPVLLRLTLHDPRVSHLFPRFQEVLDQNVGDGAP
jgi:tetratricopeptide (TPR) repeat protein